jgi:hypothetical protein
VHYHPLSVEFKLIKERFVFNTVTAINKEQFEFQKWAYLLFSNSNSESESTYKQAIDNIENTLKKLTDTLLGSPSNSEEAIATEEQKMRSEEKYLEFLGAQSFNSLGDIMAAVTEFNNKVTGNSE